MDLLDILTSSAGAVPSSPVAASRRTDWSPSSTGERVAGRVPPCSQFARLPSAHENPESGAIEEGADESPSAGMVSSSQQVQKQGLSVGFARRFDRATTRSTV